MQSTRISAAEVRAACISTATRKAYESNLSVISKWIRKTQSNHELFFDASGDINLDVFTHQHFEDFLIDRFNDPTRQVKATTLSGYRSAIKDLYRSKMIALPAEYGEGLKTLFSGFKRRAADSVQSGSARDSGKAALNYSTYEALCGQTIRLTDGGFGHLFLTTQWNLMCRSKSVQTLDTSHISNEDDSIGITFHKTKTNQDGSGAKDPRHNYANPFSVTTCWVTALGLYWACNAEQGPGQLFPGANQKQRFGKMISRTLGKDGIVDKQYGTHSVRKGVATFACSGSTGGPSIVSVCIRCGWTLGGVQDRYLRYEAAGDQFLGRVVAGLPLSKPEFATLPPHFRDPKDELCTHTVSQMFPKLVTERNLRGVLHLCLASLVYHSAQLKQLLPPTHPLFSTFVFRDCELHKNLLSRVTVNDESWIKPTGIPPHVVLYKQQQRTQESVERMPNIVLAGVSKLIDEKGVAAGNITHSLLKETIRELVSDITNASNPRSETSQPPAPADYQLHFWGNKLHALPEDFDFPRVDTFAAWKLWWFGNRALKHPPYKSINTVDLSTRKKQQTFSEWKAMMRHIVDCVEEATGQPMPQKPTEHEANQLYDVARGLLPIEPSTAKDRKRRSTQLRMVTALRLVREAKRQRSCAPTTTDTNN